METTKINPVEIEIKIVDAQGNEFVPVRHGHWIENDTTYAEVTRQTCTCSVCGQHSPRPLGEFCRWCGAKMDEEGKYLVDERPTVDAIPIEWIKEWINNYCDWNQEKLIEVLLRTWSKMGEVN
jgi:hypothetical protein